MLIRKRSNIIYATYFMVQIVVDNIVNIGVSTRVSQSISVKAKERGCTNDDDRGKGKKSRSTKIIFMLLIHTFSVLSLQLKELR